jgi:hypothetical protein
MIAAWRSSTDCLFWAIFAFRITPILTIIDVDIVANCLIRQQLKARYFGMPKIRALLEATYFAGLRKVGMPEE